MTIRIEYPDSSGIVRQADIYTASEIGDIAAPDIKVYEPHYLTQEQALSRKILLSSVPVVASIEFTPNGALRQRINIDFSYVELDNSLTWDGLGLEGFLVEGELVEIYYTTNG